MIWTWTTDFFHWMVQVGLGNRGILLLALILVCLLYGSSTFVVSALSFLFPGPRQIVSHTSFVLTLPMLT